jgi:hypothetical protein
VVGGVPSVMGRVYYYAKYFIFNNGTSIINLYSLFCFMVYVKSKAVLLQAWSGPEGSRKLRFPDFMTTAQDGGKVVSLMHRPPLPPVNHLVLISVRG